MLIFYGLRAYFKRSVTIPSLTGDSSLWTCWSANLISFVSFQEYHIYNRVPVGGIFILKIYMFTWYPSIIWHIFFILVNFLVYFTVRYCCLSMYKLDSIPPDKISAPLTPPPHHGKEKPDMKGNRVSPSLITVRKNFYNSTFILPFFFLLLSNQQIYKWIWAQGL